MIRALKIQVSWDVTQCQLISFRRFGGVYIFSLSSHIRRHIDKFSTFRSCLHIQGLSSHIRRHIGKFSTFRICLHIQSLSSYIRRHIVEVFWGEGGVDFFFVSWAGFLRLKLAHGD